MTPDHAREVRHPTNTDSVEDPQGDHPSEEPRTNPASTCPVKPKQRNSRPQPPADAADARTKQASRNVRLCGSRWHERSSALREFARPRPLRLGTVALVAMAGVAVWRLAPAHPLPVAAGAAIMVSVVLLWRRHRRPLLLVASCLWWFVSSPFVAFMTRVGPHGLTRDAAASIPSAALAVVLIGLIVTLIAACQRRRNAWVTVLLSWIAYTGTATLVASEAGSLASAASAIAAVALVLAARGQRIHASSRRARRTTGRTAAPRLSPAAWRTLKSLEVLDEDWTILSPNRTHVPNTLVVVGPSGVHCLASHDTDGRLQVGAAAARVVGTDLKRTARAVAREAITTSRTCGKPVAALIVLNGDRTEENHILRTDYDTRLVTGSLLAPLLILDDAHHLSPLRARRCVTRLRRAGLVIVAPPASATSGDAVVRVVGDTFRAGWRMLPVGYACGANENGVPLCRESDWRRAQAQKRRVPAERVAIVPQESVFKRSTGAAP